MSCLNFEETLQVFDIPAESCMFEPVNFQPSKTEKVLCSSLEVLPFSRGIDIILEDSPKLHETNCSVKKKTFSKTMPLNVGVLCVSGVIS